MDDDSNLWPDGSAAPEECLGRSLSNKKVFRMFRSREECRRAGYLAVFGDFVQSWDDVPA